MDIVLVVMPFADVGRPAIGVSLLKADAPRTRVAENKPQGVRSGLSRRQRVIEVGNPTDFDSHIHRR